MKLKDCRGLELSTRNPDSVERLEEALALTVSDFLDPLATINGALEQEPDFAMGHCLRAALGVMSTERGALPMIRESVEAVEGLGNRATDRERAHAVAARRWMEGDLAGGMRAYGEIIIDHPRDLLALQVAHVGDFFLGQSTMLRDRVAQVLPHWSATIPGYGYVLGMHAFGLEETGLYDRAEDAGRKALDTSRRPLGRPRSGARDGNAGSHPRRHRVPGVSRAGLVRQQRARVPQLVASRAASPRVGRA
jgi:hypothetical protein